MRLPYRFRFLVKLIGGAIIGAGVVLVGIAGVIRFLDLDLFPPATAEDTDTVVSEVLVPAVPKSTVVPSSEQDGDAEPQFEESYLVRPVFPMASTIVGVPGGIRPEGVDEDLLRDGSPRPWIPDNGAHMNAWTHPYVLEGLAPDKDPATVYTNHVSFNQGSGSTYEVTFFYGMWLYENGELEEVIAHSTYHQLLWIWGAKNGQPGHDGIGWWGPVPVDGEESRSWVNVTYLTLAGEEIASCTEVHSFEVVPGVKIKLTFVNEGDTSAVWGQGPWGESSGFGIIEPECSP